MSTHSGSDALLGGAASSPSDVATVGAASSALGVLEQPITTADNRMPKAERCEKRSPRCQVSINAFFDIFIIYSQVLLSAKYGQLGKVP